MSKNTMLQGDTLAATIKAAFDKSRNDNRALRPLLDHWIKLSSEVDFIDLEVAMNMATLHIEDMFAKWERWSLATRSPKTWFMCEMAKEEWQKLEVMCQVRVLLIEIANKLIPEPEGDAQWDYETLDDARAAMLDFLFRVKNQQRAMATGLLLLA